MKNNPIKKVAIIGPECTGKSELAQFLALHFNTCWVKEYARNFLTNLRRPYQESDLMEITYGQVQEEDHLFRKANQVLICDTNLIVIKIWSYIKYSRCNKKIIQLINSRYYDLHLLTYIDIPWKSDPQREYPNQREKLWHVYKEELERQTIPHIEIRGDRENRRKIAIHAITNMINSQK